MHGKNEPVAMPEKRITYKKAPNGTIYVYYTLRAYRNKDGKPTSDEAAIGKKDKETGKLIPNRRYYEIFQDRKLPVTSLLPSPKAVRSCGIVAALMETANRLGLTNLLKKFFPDQWAQMLASAFYILCEGNVMMYIEDWFDETDIKFTKRMDDSDCNRLFASITEANRKNFFAEWMKCLNVKENTADNASCSCNLYIAERGYNRNNETFPRVNLGMYYGVTAHVPVYYNLYKGGISEKTCLEFMATRAKDLGFSDVCFVLDPGIYEIDNLRYMHTACHCSIGYVAALPRDNYWAEKLINENKADICKAENWSREHEVFGIKRNTNLEDIHVAAHIFHDPAERLQADLELKSPPLFCTYALTL